MYLVAQPSFQPSASTYGMSCAAAKSMYRLTFSVVAPCGRAVAVDHSDWPLWISHHTPTYLPGLIHDVSRSQIAHGSLRFRTSVDSIRSPGVSPMTSVRQGDAWRPEPRTLTPSGSATRAERSDEPPAGATFIAA